MICDEARAHARSSANQRVAVILSAHFPTGSIPRATLSLNKNDAFHGGTGGVNHNTKQTVERPRTLTGAYTSEHGVLSREPNMPRPPTHPIARIGAIRFLVGVQTHNPRSNDMTLYQLSNRTGLVEYCL